MIAHKFLDIHQVVSVITIKKCGVRRLDDEKGEWQVAGDIASIKSDIGITQRGDIPAFGYGKMERIVVELPAKKPFYPHRILERKYGVLTGDGPAVVLSLIELLVRSPAKSGGQLRGRQLRHGIGPGGLRFINIIQGLSRLLEPIFHPQVVREMVPEFMDIGQAANI